MLALTERAVALAAIAVAAWPRHRRGRTTSRAFRRRSTRARRCSPGQSRPGAGRAGGVRRRPRAGWRRSIRPTSRRAGRRSGSTGCSSARSCNNQDSYLYTRGRALYMYTHNAGHARLRQRLRLPRAPDGRQPDAVHGRRSPASRSRRRPRSAASTRATGAAPTRRPGLSVAQRKFITHNNVAVDGADGHEHRHGADDAHGDRRVAGGDHVGGARHRVDRRGHRPLRPDHDHAAPERRGLHGQRHLADPRAHTRPRPVDARSRS